jgi:hypothetical protein
VRCPTFNGKAERLFRAFRDWSSGLLLAFFADKVRICRWFQRRLNIFRDWYNEVRTHQAIGGRTPEEVWQYLPVVEPESITARDAQPEVTVKRRWFRGDHDLHRLPVFDIQLRRSA